MADPYILKDESNLVGILLGTHNGQQDIGQEVDSFRIQQQAMGLDVETAVPKSTLDSTHGLHKMNPYLIVDAIPRLRISLLCSVKTIIF